MRRLLHQGAVMHHMCNRTADLRCMQTATPNSTSAPPQSHFTDTTLTTPTPSPAELQQRFRQQLGSVAASPLQQPDLGPESSGLPGQRLVLGVSSAAAEVEGQGGCPQAPASMRTELAPQQPAGSGEAGPVAAGAGAARAGAGGAGGKKVSSRIERELKLLQPWAWDG